MDTPLASVQPSRILGIDIGGSGIKGAPVDLEQGVLSQERQRIPTPQPSKPQDVAEVVAAIVNHFSWQGAIGCTFPAVVKHGVTYSAANVHQDWIGYEAAALLERHCQCPVLLLNDADAAGIAEMHYGAGRGHQQRGVVMILTLGTGIGSALFVDGRLVPNTELGHLELQGREVEPWASAKARKEQGLGWKKWAKRLSAYFRYLEFLFSPDLFIIGGGVSKKSDKFLPHIAINTPIIPAQLLNDAGIIGAAYAAQALSMPAAERNAADIVPSELKNA